MFDFDEELQKLAHLFKYKGFSKLIKFLGRFSAESIPDQFTDSDIAVPVPLHFRRKFARGFNQSLLLASGILEGLDMERKLSPGILKRIRYTKTQTKLNNTERIANIKGAFALNPEYAEVIKGKKITLFDDIATTLATGNECARVLIDNGAESVKLITLSHD